jgi:hypothetical protein
MRSLFAPLKLDADSKKLHFVTELDRTIDDVRFYLQVGIGDHEGNVLTAGRGSGPLFRVGSQ